MRIMKLSYSTIAALSELSKISPTIILGRAGDIFTFDPTKAIRATANVPDRFPRDVAFEDIGPFLGMLGLLGPRDTDVSFDVDGCRLSAPPDEAFLVIANAPRLRELLRHKPEERGSRLHTVFEFTYGSKQLRQLQRVVTRIKGKARCELRLASDGKSASLTLQSKLSKTRKNEGQFDSFRQPLGICPKTFAFVLPASILSLLPSDDYGGLIATHSKITELRLTASTRRITYAAQLSVSTVETLHPKAPREA